MNSFTSIFDDTNDRQLNLPSSAPARAPVIGLSNAVQYEDSVSNLIQTDYVPVKANKTGEILLKSNKRKSHYSAIQQKMRNQPEIKAKLSKYKISSVYEAENNNKNDPKKSQREQQEQQQHQDTPNDNAIAHNSLTTDRPAITSTTTPTPRKIGRSHTERTKVLPLNHRPDDDEDEDSDDDTIQSANIRN